MILGSTGSIGKSTLGVVRAHRDRVAVTGISTKSNVELLKQQLAEFGPQAIAVGDDEKAQLLKKEINAEIALYSGKDGLIEFVNHTEADLVVCSLVGAAGLQPTLEAIRAGKDIALANKEVLVMAGDIVKKEVKDNSVRLLPVDSEHSALAQCLWKRDPKAVKRLIITASGGPFYSQTGRDLNDVTVAEALRHPRWQMGPKVTIDSATLMNKGFEVIEASYLFDIPLDRIDVVIHPESIVHSIVEFVDGTMIAQMHVPDMRIPIQFALSWPERWGNDFGSLDLASLGTLNFSAPNKERFPALDIALNAAAIGGTMPAVLNASDEVCVQKFLDGEIRLGDITEIVTQIIEQHQNKLQPNITDIVQADAWARKETLSACHSLSRQK